MARTGSQVDLKSQKPCVADHIPTSDHHLASRGVTVLGPSRVGARTPGPDYTSPRRIITLRPGGSPSWGLRAWGQERPGLTTTSPRRIITLRPGGSTTSPRRIIALRPGGSPSWGLRAWGQERPGLTTTSGSTGSSPDRLAQVLVLLEVGVIVGPRAHVDPVVFSSEVTHEVGIPGCQHLVRHPEFLESEWSELGCEDPRFGIGVSLRIPMHNESGSLLDHPA
jgi:hypothetical protein